MKKHLILKSLTLLTCFSLGVFFTSCSDDDDKSDKPTPAREILWSKTMAGNDLEEIAWPDRSENYWEYTIDVAENPNIGVKFKGKFPKGDTRFFNFTFYNDNSTQRITSIEDFNIVADPQTVNPFNPSKSTLASPPPLENSFEITIVPATTSQAVKDKLRNVLEFDATTVKKLSVLLRIYFNSAEHGTDFGRVELPEIVFIDTTTGKELDNANRTDSRYYAMCKLIASQIPQIESQPAMVFTLAPDVMYSNGPTGYVTSANTVSSGEVLAFRFIAPAYPKSVAENRTADIRYWSICVGDAVKTITPVTIPDADIKLTEGGYANVIIFDKNDPKKAELKAKAASLNINAIEWDSKTYGKELMVFYRQMHIRDGFDYSVKKVPSYPPLGASGLPDTSVPIEAKNMAHNVLFEHGPCGRKLTTDNVLSETFSYNSMRIPSTTGR